MQTPISSLPQEVLGYNTTINDDSPGSGTVAGYYGVTGCRAPNNASDRGCLRGVPWFIWRSEPISINFSKDERLFTLIYPYLPLFTLIYPYLPAMT